MLRQTVTQALRQQSCSRFDVHDFSKERKDMCENLEKVAEDRIAPEVTTEKVERVFWKVNPKKPLGQSLLVEK